MARPDGITWAWITGRDQFPQPCDFCGEPIHKEHVYRVEGDKKRCERCLCKLDREYNQHAPDCRMPSAGEAACKCFDAPHPLRVKWAITVDTYAKDNTGEWERDAWNQLGPDFDTLAEAYEAAKPLTHRSVNLIKWYITSTGRSGSPSYKGFGDKMPPIEVIQARADGTGGWEIPPPMKEIVS